MLKSRLRKCSKKFLENAKKPYLKFFSKNNQRSFLEKLSKIFKKHDLYFENKPRKISIYGSQAQNKKRF